MKTVGALLDEVVMARSGLLDALEALEPHLGALILIGAQAVYLHTGQLEFAGGTDARGSAMAGAAEELVGDPRGVAESVALLAQELLAAPGR